MPRNKKAPRGWLRGGSVGWSASSWRRPSAPVAFRQHPNKGADQGIASSRGWPYPSSQSVPATTQPEQAGAPRRLHAPRGSSGLRGAFYLKREHQVASFTGRLSRDGELLTDQAWGEIDKVQANNRVQWPGTIYFPIALQRLIFDSRPIRLDCDNRFAILIDLGDSTVSADGQWIVAEFFSHGGPIT